VSAPTITVGVNVRHWITFRVIDATPEEVAILSSLDSDAAADLAGDLFNADRLEWVSADSEQDWNPFEEHRDPNVIDCNTEAEVDA